MKTIKILLVSFILLLISGCSDFLDIVPDNTPSLDDAFSNRAVMEKFLFTCYNPLPDPTDPFYYPAYYTSRDEFDVGVEPRGLNSVAGRIARGLQNSNTPLQDYWSGYNGGKPMYEAIRNCNIFLENAHLPRDIGEDERSRWIAEVKFLKAYYHFFLVQLYGPIVLVKENLPLSASPQEVMLYREPVDECIDYIVELLDEATPNLPLNVPSPVDEDGRITQPIALSVKAKALVWAASPLFNGNPDYRNWIDKREKHLMSQENDPTKWKRAAVAIKNAIDTCHLAGLKLYEFNPASTPQSYNMNDSLVLTMTSRKVVSDRWNTGVIWSSTENFANGKGGSTALGYNIVGDLQRMLFPVMYPTDSDKGVAYYGASWHMGQLFYSNNGVPIEEDPSFDYDNRFEQRVAKAEDKHNYYIATGQSTPSLHFNREPRFYGNLAFDRGYFEIATATTNSGHSFEPYLKFKPGEIMQHGVYGYLPKKLIAFESSCSQGQSTRGYTGYDYRFPLIRLADLYLLYSEALNEINTQPNEEVFYWIDEVRRVAGLRGVVESWQNSSRYADRPKSKLEMRKIIQQERFIELAFEGQRFWDVRRWKLAQQLWTRPPTRWGDSKIADEYAVPEEYDVKREFTFKDYLWPIKDYDIRVNSNLVQTYGW